MAFSRRTHTRVFVLCTQVRNEIQVLKRVSKGHPNIVTLHDYFEVCTHYSNLQIHRIGYHGRAFSRAGDWFHRRGEQTTQHSFILHRTLLLHDTPFCSPVISPYCDSPGTRAVVATMPALINSHDCPLASSLRLKLDYLAFIALRLTTHIHRPRTTSTSSSTSARAASCSTGYAPREITTKRAFRLL